jgi:four helix bundle protein
MAFAFEKLQACQRAVAFADAVCTLTRSFPRGYFFLADQLNPAALSVAANIAEGNGPFAKPDRKSFFGIARGSAQDCVPLLEIAGRRGFIDEPTHQQLRADLEEIARMPSRLITGLDKREIWASARTPPAWWRGDLIRPPAVRRPAIAAPCGAGVGAGAHAPAPPPARKAREKVACPLLFPGPAGRCHARNRQ